jgi:hypothetical protein
MSGKHTPGPWTVLHLTDRQIKVDSCLFIRGPTNVSIAAMIIGGFTARADGNLIAAAPDLLSALESMLVGFESNYTDGTKAKATLIRAARAAIARAKGESHVQP